MLLIDDSTGQLISAMESSKGYMTMDENFKSVEGTEVILTEEGWNELVAGSRMNFRHLTHQELADLRNGLKARMGIEHWVVDRPNFMSRPDGLQLHMPCPGTCGTVRRNGAELESFTVADLKLQGWDNPFEYADSKYPQAATG